jgi:hypothetical protein
MGKLWIHSLSFTDGKSIIIYIYNYKKNHKMEWAHMDIQGMYGKQRIYPL